MANELYLKYGTLSQYTAATKDAGTLYFTEEGYLFKGDVEISTVKYMAAKPAITGNKFADSKIKDKNLIVVTSGDDAGAYYATVGATDTLTPVATRRLTSFSDVDAALVVKNNAIKSYNEASDEKFVTEKAVAYAVSQVVSASDAMVFKGTLGGVGATVTELPASHKVGDTYRVTKAGTYAGQKCEVGDLIIAVTTGAVASDADWTVAQTNIDGAITSISGDDIISVAGAGASRTLTHKKSSVTANPEGTAYNSVRVDAYGHVTAGETIAYLTEHPSIAITEGAADTTGTDIAVGKAAKTLKALTDITRDANGHVTGFKYREYSVAHEAIATATTTPTANVAAGGTFVAVSKLTVGDNGHVTELATTTYTIPEAYVHPDVTRNDTTAAAADVVVNEGKLVVVKSITSDAQGHITAVETQEVSPVIRWGTIA